MIRTIVAIVVAGLLTIGCANTSTITTYYEDGVTPKSVTEMSASDYDSHTRARVEFKKADSERMTDQANGIRVMSQGNESYTKTENLLLTVIGINAIGDLEPQEYGERAPMTTTEAITELGGKVVTGTIIGLGIKTLGDVAEAGIHGAGDGDKSTGKTTIHAEADNQSTTEVSVDNSRTIDIETHTTTDNSEVDN